MMRDDPYTFILDKLDERGCKVQRRGDSAVAQCPAHEDRSPSLSVRAIEGQVLVYCHAGCRTDDIVAALDMHMRDLFDDPKGATYSYDDGRIVHRSPGKRFRQSGNTNGTAQLYRLSRITAAVEAGTTITVVEGEKDVHAIERLGFVATCSPMGAGKAHKADWTPLRGATVAIVADKDEPGEKHAAQVLEILNDLQCTVSTWQAKVGKDIADHIAAGYGPSDLIPLELATTKPPPYVDLSWLLSGEPPKIDTPEWVKRDDNVGLFYSGRINGIYGDPETAKTWLAMLGIVQALAQHQRAALVDLDHNGQQETTKRLMLLGADHKDLANPDRFRYYEPGDGPELLDDIVDLVEWQPAFAILDSLGELVPMLGGKSNDNDDITTAMRRTAVRLADTGACVIIIDHLPKSKEARTTGYAIGGTSKKRMTNGSYLEAKINKIPEPGGVGKIALTVSKDRSGGLRQHAHDKYVGTLILDSTSVEATTATIQAGARPTIADTEDDEKLEPIMEQISDHMEIGQTLSKNQIYQAVGGNKKTVWAAIRLMQDAEYLAQVGLGQYGAHLMELKAKYQQGGDGLS